MNKISEKLVIRAHTDLTEMSDDFMERLTYRFTDQQPYLVAFLLTAFEDQLQEEEQEFLFMSGLLIWYAVLLQEDAVQTVSDGLIDQCESANLPIFKYLDTDEIETWEESIDTIIDNYPQSELLAAGTGAMLDDSEDEAPIALANKTLLFVALKTFTDALLYRR